MLIHTRRLRIITCQEEHLAAIVEDPASLGAVLGVSVPAQWPAHPAAYPHALAALRKRPLLASSGWWLYLFVDAARKSLVGCGGFKSAPDADGVVEIGCEIAPAYRRNGYASEALLGLIGYAFTRAEVSAVDAVTRATKCAQTAVLASVGMARIGDAMDKVAGKVWLWRITRQTFVATAANRRN